MEPDEHVNKLEVERDSDHLMMSSYQKKKRIKMYKLQ